MEEHGTTVLFDIFGLKVSSFVTTMWAVMAVILIISFFATRNLKKVPTGAQNVMEFLVQTLIGFFAGVMGEKNAKQYLPILATFFIFICSPITAAFYPWQGICRDWQHTALFSVTAGFALFVFFCTHFFGIKERDWVILNIFAVAFCSSYDCEEFVVLCHYKALRKYFRRGKW